MSENSNSQLPTLIQLGKEQGYLTYAEINDQMPDSVTDSDQVEEIIQMLTDVGIPIYDVAPDEDDMLLTGVSNDDDDIAVDEAATVLANVETEPGRTTDPVRMYMREMGTVELLTRDGEIGIAKRIEEGMREVQYIMAYWPGTVKFVLGEYEQVLAGEKKISDVVTGFLELEDGDFELKEDEIEPDFENPQTAIKVPDDHEEEDEHPDALAVDDADDSSLDPEEVRVRFEEIQTLFAKAKKTLDKHGRNSEKAKQAYDELATRFMLIKLNNRLSDQVMTLMREVYDDVRTTERQIMRLVVRRGKMPLEEFKKTFPSNETNVEWLAHRIEGKPAFAETYA